MVILICYTLDITLPLPLLTKNVFQKQVVFPSSGKTRAYLRGALASAIPITLKFGYFNDVVFTGFLKLAVLKVLDDISFWSFREFKLSQTSLPYHV
jgi:hypothetical protein